jgi:2-polyprenyl-6-methoxyphenol hydroxylase-like FAD-dependent oxidoreductase
MTDAFRDAELLADAAHLALSDPTVADDALAAYAQARDAALEPTFRLTRALGAFPPADRFVELQVELSRALDAEAQTLAERPLPDHRLLQPVAG